MRILLSTYGSRGDVEPLVAAAVELQALGAEAVVSAPPDQDLIDLVDRAGIEFAPAFMSVRQWIEEARREPRPIAALSAILIPAQYRALDAAAVGCDAIVSTGLFPSAAAAWCVAEKRGLLHRHVAFCPLSLPSEAHWPFPRPGYPLPPEVTDARTLWEINARHMDALFGEATNAQRTAVGLPPVTDVRDHVATDRPLLASDPVLWPWQPTDLCDPIQTGAWILEDQRPLAGDLTAFLDAGTPPVYVGFGSINLPTTKDAAVTAIRAIRDRNRRVVLASGWADNALPDDEGDCFLVGEVNQQALFGRVAAVIHHGGAGTTTTAARAGAAQIIVPQIVDQPYWAARVAGLGIGAAHDGPGPTLESLSAALDIALAPETGARAKAVSETIRADGAAAAARYLLDAVSRKPA